MHNRYAITLTIILAVSLAGPGVAQESDVDPWVDADPEARALMAAQLMAFLGSRLDHIAGNLAQHFQLDEVPALRASAQGVLKRDDLKALFRDAANAPSLEPFLKAVLVRHLSGQQLEDYLVFIQARKDRDRNAVAGQLLAWADQQLSLNSGQRATTGQLFLRLPDKRITTQGLLHRDARAFLDLAVKLELDVKQLEGVLASSQIKVWELMIPAGNERAWWRKAPNAKEREAQFAVVQADIVEAFDTGRITRARAAQQLEAAKRKLRADLSVRRDNAVKREERVRLIAVAKLAAHTEQLGDLDAPALKRLTLVAKGVVEQVNESWDTGQGDDPTALIMEHPLYQETIQGVLAEDAYLRYQTGQTQRAAFRDRSRRDLVVAYLDTQLLLSETQRNDLAQAAAKLHVPKQGNAWGFLVQVLRQIDHQDLSQWQRGLVEGMLKAGTRLKQ